MLVGVKGGGSSFATVPLSKYITHLNETKGISILVTTTKFLRQVYINLTRIRNVKNNRVHY